MSKDVVKIKMKDMQGRELPGNFICKKKETAYFLERFTNSLFIVDNDEYGNLYLDFEKYLLNLFEVCGQSKTKPSIIYINGDVGPDKIKQKLGDEYFDVLFEEDVYLLDKKPAFYIPFENDNYGDLIERFIQERTNNIVNRKMFVIIDNIEKLSLPMIDKYVTLSRSRNMYFIILIANKKLFKEKYMNENLEILKANCMLHFLCDADKIKECKVSFMSDTVIKIDE